MQKTHGQKRRQRINIIAVLAFMITTAAAAVIYQGIMSSAYDWVNSRVETTGVVTALISEEEEYRNSRGRLRTATYYYADYTFEVDDELIESSAELSSGLYGSLSEGDNIEVWYAQDDPYLHEIAANVENGQKTSPVSALMAIGPFTLGFAFGLRALLLFFFGRESRKKLAEGFYTENSWLDVDDRKLVLLSADKFVTAKFEEKHSSDLTRVFQSGASHNELLAMFTKDQIKQAHMHDVTHMKSRHDNDVIELTAGEDILTLDFLNIGTKEHALERIVKTLPAEFSISEQKRSRLRSAMPRLIVYGVLAAMGVAAGMFAVWLIVGVVMLYMAPQLIRRLLDPTRQTLIVREEAKPSVNDEQLPKAA